MKNIYNNNLYNSNNLRNIVNAIKLLKSELNNFKIEKSEKLQSRGNMKIEKILECISLIKQLKENKCWDKCPLFVQLNKVIETVESNKADIISLKNVIKTADINKPEVNKLKNKLNSNVVSDYSTEMTNKEGQKKNVSSSLWSDIAKSEDNGIPFSTVNGKKSRRNNNNCEKQNNSGETSNNPTNNKQTGKKTAMKIIGKKVSNDCKLKADKILMKKSVFCLSNVSKCHRNDVMAYLTDNGIHVVSCYPVLKQFNKMAPASTADVNNNNNSQTENKKNR
ncbi:hypothetical protein HELRODRAFT_182195 [Helobdella robusta]|uniref:Uncharacterized protein n=1 Tax=Helobdella robusta TaxID=6412 RepID=T1FHW7_HELRO|nr:hypothetical protein HELRODRAFT_182195 [Helobdella robusta]ESN91121.1 hypothetical protein HELRODRAFT_182195 [Helobdella robusta]